MPTGPGGAPTRPGVTVAGREQAWNDRQLAAPVEVPRAALWCYQEPAVVLGRSQIGWLVARSDAGGTTMGRLALIPRQAGGGAVLVGPWMLSLSVVLPPTHPLVQHRTVTDSYRWLAGAWAEALGATGIATVAASDAVRAGPDAAWACFAGVTPPELLVDGRKLVGFAQRRHRHGVLFVAGILLAAVPWRRLIEAVASLDPEPFDPVAARTILERTTIDLVQAGGDASAAGRARLEAALQAALARALGPTAVYACPVASDGPPADGS